MIKVIIAEDQGMLRGALGTLLSLEDNIEVIGEADNGLSAYQLIEEKKPDVCLLDIEMPELTGLDVAEKIKEHQLSTKVMILTTFGRPGYFQRAMASGVYGFLLKDGPINELVEAIHKVNQGKRVINSELSYSVWGQENPLTDREQEIIRLASQGKTASEIASELFLSHGTVRNYMSEILQKLEVKNKIEAISKAEKEGWI